MAVDQQVLSVSDLFSVLPLGKSTIYKLVSRNDFPKIRVGKRIIIPRDQFVKWMEENTGTTVELTGVK